MRWFILISWAASEGCTLPVEPRAACGDYVACVQAQDAAEGVTTDVDRYLAEGECWGGAEIADLCERSCENGLAWLHEHPDGLPEVCR